MDAYAIIETGGKQLQATPGAELKIEKLPGAPGEAVRFERVLLVSRDGDVRLGRPYVDGASVTGTVVAQDRERKIRVFKMKRRKHYRRTRGHRQPFTAVRIDAIEG